MCSAGWQSFDLPLGGHVRLDPSFMAAGEADELFRRLRTEVSWIQGMLTIFGRPLAEPRLTAWFGDEDYTYSGRTMPAAPWPPMLAALRRQVEEAAAVPFNAVLLNLYRDGRDSMGMHSDDEPELGRDPVIASVSLGETRTFVLEPKRKSARVAGRRRLPLGHGSLLIMAGSCQHHYRHGLPKQLACRGERINLTFRYVHASP